MRDITDFRIGTANYILENSRGAKIRLVLNYADNSFSYEVIREGGNMRRLKNQAGIIAKDMLGRKAQKNLNYKLIEIKDL